MKPPDVKHTRLYTIDTISYIPIFFQTLKYLNFCFQILAMIEEAAGTRMYECKKISAQKTIEKKEAKLKEIQMVCFLTQTRFDSLPRMQLQLLLKLFSWFVLPRFWMRKSLRPCRNSKR